MYPYFSKKDDEPKTDFYSKQCVDEDNSIDEEGDDFNEYILEMILEAIKDEWADMNYYEQLFKSVEDEDAKRILRRIHLDEMKHYNMLNNLYFQLTGIEPRISFENLEIGNNMSDELEKSFERELDSVDFYKSLLTSFLDIGVRDMIFTIMVDEQGHAQKISYLYNKYRNC